MNMNILGLAIYIFALLSACGGSNSGSNSGNVLINSISDDSLPQFESLLKRSNEFAKRVTFPTQDNLIKNIATSSEIKKDIVRHMEATYPIVHAPTYKLINSFLEYKKKHGSNVERVFYKDMTAIAFIDRLLKKRPLAFLTGSDSYMLRNNLIGAGGFEKIGHDNQVDPLVLSDYISYDEMQISALFGVSVPTFFINDGGRYNKGIAAPKGTFEAQGIYIGQVGARFERPGLMEWAHMIITPIQNTGANGYGLHPTKRNFLLTLWEEFYGLTFASFDEAKADTSGRYLKLPDNNYFDTAVYKKRMAAIIEPFLFDANERAKTHSKKAYVHVVGLGLGAWQKLNAQGTLLAEVYADILSKHSFPFIADIDFSWFPKEVTSIGGVNNNKIFNAGANNIVIHFSKRNPAELLSGPNKGKLLVAQYAWDSNSYPGNEYWLGALSATGDPAAASCSTIPELQNPEINENVAGAQTRAYGG